MNIKESIKHKKRRAHANNYFGIPSEKQATQEKIYKAMTFICTKVGQRTKRVTFDDSEHRQAAIREAASKFGIEKRVIEMIYYGKTLPL